MIFDVISVYTVNHLDTVSPIVNRIVHIFYMGLMLSIFYIAYKYLESIIEEEIGKEIKRYNFSLIPLIVTIIGVAVYVFFIIWLMVQYGKIIPKKKKKAIYYALLSEIPIAIYQIMVPEALITCLGMVLLNLGIRSGEYCKAFFSCKGYRHRNQGRGFAEAMHAI